MFPGFLTPVLTQLFFPKPPTTFLICFCRSERRKYAGKNSRLNQGSNSQPPGHESDTLTTEPHEWGRALTETLPNNKMLGWSKLKAFANNNRNINEKFKFCLGRVGNIVGKGENAGYQHFLLFQQCFQKPSVQGH